MPDEDGRYSDAERRTYQGPPCPVCGGPTIQEWADASSLADHPGAKWWLPDSYRCRNPLAHKE